MWLGRADRCRRRALLVPMLWGAALWTASLWSAPAWAGRPGQPWPPPAQARAPQPPEQTSPSNGPVPSDGFGRWESSLSQCQVLWPSQARSNCLKLRLDQSIEGMLRVRFINAGGGSRYASEELSFAGLLLKEHQPMHCRQGHCSPTWPMRLQVLGVASRRFDSRGLVEQLPNNQLAKGSCQLDAEQLSCQAVDRAGQSWKASARLPRHSAP